LVCGGPLEIQTPSHTHPHLPEKGFGAVLTPVPSPLGLGGLKL